MNRFEYPKDARLLAIHVNGMEVGNVVKIDGRVYSMESVQFGEDDRRFYLTAHMSADEGDVNGYRYIHCRFKDGHKAVWGSPASMASAITRHDVKFS